MSRASRRTTKGTVIGLVLAYLFWSTHRPHLWDVSLPGVVSFNGRWVQIEQPSVQDLLTFYGPRHGATCRYEVKRMVGYTDQQRAAIEAERAIHVGSYRWILDHGRFDDWDPVLFIERLVMSRLGLVAIGDSLTVQMMEACKSLLMAPVPAHYNLSLTPDIPIFIDLPNLVPKPKHTIQGVEYEIKHSISNQGLNPHHPVTLYLKDKHPEIPADRWNRSFIWTIFNDYGCTPKQMDAFMREAGVQGPDDAHLVTLTERANRGDWPLFLETAQTDYASWPGMLKDVVILNTGAHWPGNFGSAILNNQSAAIGIYPKMVSSALDTFAKLNGTVTGLIRSGYRGHPTCSQYSQPWTEPPDFSDPGLFPDHGWYSSALFDDEWITQIGQRPATERAQFLDLREMEGLRADAHQEPDLDCLHVTSIGCSCADSSVVCTVYAVLVDSSGMACHRLVPSKCLNAKLSASGPLAARICQGIYLVLCMHDADLSEACSTSNLNRAADSTPQSPLHHSSPVHL